MFKKNSTSYKILAISLSVVITATIGFIITRAGSLNPPGAPDAGTMHNLNALAGSGFSSSTDSLEAIRNQGDASWTTASGFSTHSAADVWTSGTRTLSTSCQSPYIDWSDCEYYGICVAAGGNEYDLECSANFELVSHSCMVGQNAGGNDAECKLKGINMLYIIDENDIGGQVCGSIKCCRYVIP